MKLPFLCPNSSLSSRFSGMAPQLMAMKRLPLPALGEACGPLAGDELLAGSGLAQHQGTERSVGATLPQDLEHAPSSA